MPFIPDEELKTPIKTFDLPMQASGFIPDEPEITEQPKRISFLERAGSTLGSIFGGEKIGEAIGTEATRLGLTGLTKEQRKFVGPGPSAGQITGDIGQIGLTLGTLGGLGTGGGLAIQALKGAGLGAGFSTAGQLKEGQAPTLGNTLLGATVGASLPLAGKGLTEASQLATKFLPSWIVRAHLPTTKDISQHVIENTKLGTVRGMLQRSSTNVEKLSNNINNLIKSKGDLISTNNLFKSVAQSYGQTGGAGTISGQEIKKTLEKVAPGVKGLLSKGNLNLQELNRVRKEVDRELGDRFFTAKHSAFSKEVAGNFNNFSRELVKKSVPETRTLFDELSKEITLRNALNKSAQKLGRIGLADLLAAAGGFFSPITAIEAIAGERAIRSPALGIAAAKGLSRLGKVTVPEAAKRLTRVGILKSTTQP